MRFVSAALVSVAIILAALIFAGRYEMTRTQTGGGAVFVLDRFTGAVRRCSALYCEEIGAEPPRISSPETPPKPISPSRAVIPRDYQKEFDALSDPPAEKGRQ